MNFWTGVFTGVALAWSAPATAAEFDWNNRQDRAQIDKWMRGFSTACADLGFTKLNPADPSTMERRIYSNFLLKPAVEADLIFRKWGSFAVTMKRLLEPAEETQAAQNAGAAITAAVVDPSSHDAAKLKFIDAMRIAYMPFLSSCEAAAADPFISANYLTGAGSLAGLEAEWPDSFEQAVQETAEYAASLEVGRKK